MMYVCYGYVDDVMVKQVAGRCHYIIYNLPFSSVHHVPQVIIILNVSRNTKKLLFSTSDHKIA